MKRISTVLLFTAGLGLAVSVFYWPSKRVHFSEEPNAAVSEQAVPLRSEPLQLHIFSDLSDDVDTKALSASLALVEPRWFVWDIALASHALRLWGKETNIPRASQYPVPYDPPPIQGSQIVQFFLKEDEFRTRMRGKRIEPFFTRTPDGWAERRVQDKYSAAHRDEFLSVAAEIGLSVDEQLNWSGQVFQIRDILQHSFLWYHPDQELEFTVVAFVHYVRAGSFWSNRFGVRYGFNDLAEHLLRRNLAEVACFATHHPYALAVLWAADQKERLLDDATRAKVKERLLEYAYELERTQLSDGSWPHNWSTRLPKRQQMDATESERIRSTGHHIEWLVLVPPELRPKRETIKKAIAYLNKTIPSLDSKRINSPFDYAPWSHAARALLVSRGKRFASEVMEEAWVERKTSKSSLSGTR